MISKTSKDRNLSAKTDIRSDHNTSTPDTAKFEDRPLGIVIPTQTETSTAQDDARFVTLGTRVGKFMTAYINVDDQRELEVRDRIKKFLEK